MTTLRKFGPEKHGSEISARPTIHDKKTTICG
jgi:hypothetical protein